MVAILLVDDEPDILTTMRNGLALFVPADVEIDTASSPTEALLQLKRKRYDALVTDQRMPGSTGLDLLAWTRTNQPEVLRVLMTAYNLDALAQDALEKAQVEWFVAKPFELPDFAGELSARLSAPGPSPRERVVA